MARVAFLGLGVMGGPMAGHLARAGHTVTVYNRTGSKALAWVAEHGHRAAPTPAEAAEGAEFVMMCVGNDHDVREVAGAAVPVMDAGATLVDHTTASVDVARELAATCAAAGLGFVDAPVSGGQAGAENGQLTVMCGTDDTAVFERITPVIDAYAKQVTLMGSAGAGQTTKMCNQIAIAGMAQGVAEAVNFAQKAGLDIDKLIGAISKGAAGSWYLEHRARTMADGEFDFGFAIEWMRKDLAICLAEAARIGARLPVTGLVDQFYAQLVERGHPRWDTSSLVDLLQHP
ncbi:MAG TPA: NAD(P)-dependent oxidoreductase [Ilumatobacter sp.]|nr:NAD(P)-dependent oxidoreductase [Ilumatobacter sp.]